MTDEKLVEAAARAAYFEYVDAFGYALDTEERLALNSGAPK